MSISLGNKIKIGALGLTAFIGLVSPGIIAREGWVNETYPDSGGVPTVCAGHTKTAVMGKRFTDEECMRLLHGDLKPAYSFLIKHATAPMTLDQIEVTNDFLFNLGEGNLRKSTFLREMNKGNEELACTSILWWDKVNGKNCSIKSSNCRGIITRREDMCNQCLSGKNLPQCKYENRPKQR